MAALVAPQWKDWASGIHGSQPEVTPHFANGPAGLSLLSEGTTISETSEEQLPKSVSFAASTGSFFTWNKSPIEQMPKVCSSAEDTVGDATGLGFCNYFRVRVAHSVSVD